VFLPRIARAGAGIQRGDTRYRGHHFAQLVIGNGDGEFALFGFKPEQAVRPVIGVAVPRKGLEFDGVDFGHG